MIVAPIALCITVAAVLGVTANDTGSAGDSKKEEGQSAKTNRLELLSGTVPEEKVRAAFQRLGLME